MHELVCATLLERAGIKSCPGKIGREALFELYGERLVVIPSDLEIALTVHLWDRSEILLPHRLRGQERENVLWHEFSHVVIHHEKLPVMKPALNGSGSFKLWKLADRCQEHLCGKVERALRLPRQVLDYQRVEELLEESGLPRELVVQRFQEYLR